MKRNIILGTTAVLALAACLWLVRHQGVSGKPYLTQSAESEVRSSKSKLIVVTEAANLAGKTATIIPHEFSAQSFEVLRALRDTENRAHFDVVRAQRRLNWAEVEAGDPVQIATYTNSSVWPKAVRALVVKNIPVKYEFVGNLGGAAIWVRKADAPLAAELLNLSTHHGVNPDLK